MVKHMTLGKQSWIVAATLASALVLPLTAQRTQDNRDRDNKHHHYKLVDMGTLGGPQSYVFVFDQLGKQLNNHGVVAGWADTAGPDPYPNSCFNSDCYVSHAYRWQNGVKKDLGTLGGGSSEVASISDSGLIVGDGENGDIDPLVPNLPQIHGEIWENGKLVDLGSLPGGGYEVLLSGVNNRGQAVGAAFNTVSDANAMPSYFYPNSYPYQSRAFLWQEGVMLDLGTLGTGTDAQAAFINDRGQVAGYSYISSSPSAACIGEIGFALATGAFIWDRESGMKDLGNFGGTCTVTYGLNNRGQVIGVSYMTGDEASRAFVWEHSTGLTDLGALQGNRSVALAINEKGEIVGGANLADGVTYHAVLWKKEGERWRKTDLGALRGTNCGFATSINASGQIIGSSGQDCTDSRAFLWEKRNPMVDINALVSVNSGLTVAEASTINNQGEIVANGKDANGNNHAVLLIPCDGHHLNVAGCDYRLVDVSTPLKEDASPVATPGSLTTEHSASPFGAGGRIRVPSTRSRAIFGVHTPK